MNTDFQKRQYGKALEIWEEKARLEYLTYCDEHGIVPMDEWTNLLHIIAVDKMDAYTQGIEGHSEPTILDKLNELSEGEPPIGIEFFGAIRSLIYASFVDGQNARNADV